MFETGISILSDKGLYPKGTVLCDTVGYSRYKGFPLWLQVIETDNRKYAGYDQRSTILKAAFLITHRRFPAFNFHPYPNSPIIFISTE